VRLDSTLKPTAQPVRPHRTARCSAALVFALALLASSPLALAYHPCTLGQATIQGVLRSHEGAPVQDAKVIYYGLEWSADCRHGSWNWYDTRTDAAGWYELAIPAGHGVLSVERHNGIGGTGRMIIRSEALYVGQARVDHRFELIRVKGLVVDPHGLSVEAGNVIYYKDPGPGVGICGTGLPETAFKEGKFEVLLDRPGPYIFSTRASIQGLPSLFPSIPIHGDTTITIQLGGHAVTGRALDSQGDPLRGALVSASGMGAYCEDTADAMGTFRVYLPTDEYRWTVKPVHGYEWSPPGRIEITGPRELDLRHDTVEWSGTVRERGSGVLLDSIQVHVNESGCFGNYVEATTGSDGRFRLQVVRGVPYQMDLWDKRVLQRHSGQIAVPAERYDSKEIERRYARVNGMQVGPVVARSDSTFELLLVPIQR
jgi:hypothetical protein